MDREELNERMKAADMFTIDEQLAGTPIDRWYTNVHVTSPEKLVEWVNMKHTELIEQRAMHDLGIHVLGSDVDDFLLGKLAIIKEVAANMRQINYGRL